MRRVRHFSAPRGRRHHSTRTYTPFQHRGQEAAGIVSFDGSRFHSNAASASSAIPSPAVEVIERLPGIMAVGHVRYSTTGATILRNVQPLLPSSMPAASRSATTATSPTG